MKTTTLQGRTSANTSINSVKLPTAFTKVTPFGHVLDYGCGRYTEHIRTHCDLFGALSYSAYDPYNQPEDVNATTRMMGANHGFDTTYCCNVLNVIDNEAAIFDVIKDLVRWTRIRGTIIIQIYEGDKTGVGRETKWDCWQRNEKTEEYIKYVEKVMNFYGEIYTLERQNNIIKVTIGG